MALAEYIHAKPVIDAEKVRLRPLQAADVPDIKTWTTDISVYTYWGKGPGKTDRNPELLFERSPKPVKSFRLGIEEKRSGRLIGEVWVYRIEKNRMASVAIRLAAAWQGKGYGTEALLQMTLSTSETRSCSGCGQRWMFEISLPNECWRNADI